MRICYFADPRAVHTKRWMKFFVERGHEMFLLSSVPAPPQYVTEIEDLGIHYRGDTGNLHLKKFWLSLQDLYKLKKVIKKDKIDILHCHFLGANAWYAALSQFHPYIITIMGGGDVCGRDWKPDSNLQEKFLTPYTLRKADLITSWSHLMAEVVRPFCPPTLPIEVVHGGVHLEKFFPAPKPEYLLAKWNIPANGKVVFSPRLMRPLSNIDKIAESFVEVCKNSEGIYLVIAAPAAERYEDYENKVKEILDKNSLMDKVRFVGAIQHHEIADYFRLADVTVSIPDTDGTPMTVLESMACATPTVIGDLADYDSDYFENEKTTLMVDVENPQAIAKAILRFLQDHDLIEKVASEARRRVEMNGSYESQMSKMERLYESLMPK